MDFVEHIDPNTGITESVRISRASEKSEALVRQSSEAMLDFFRDENLKFEFSGALGVRFLTGKEIMGFRARARTAELKKSIGEELDALQDESRIIESYLKSTGRIEKGFEIWPEPAGAKNEKTPPDTLSAINSAIGRDPEKNALCEKLLASGIPISVVFRFETHGKYRLISGIEVSPMETK